MGDLNAALERERGGSEELLGHLVRAGAAERDERAAVAGRVLAHYLEDHGITVEWQEGAPGVPILVATVGPRCGRRILLEGHLDVVPAGAGWTREPFTPLREENTLYGCGTADMKAGIAAFALALVALQETGLTHHSVTLLAVPDEETGSTRGLRPYLDKLNTRYDFAICGEPTDLDVYLGNRGVISMDVRIEGVAGHAGIPQSGVNPLPALGDLLLEVGRLDARQGERRPLVPTVVRGGEVFNQIPGEAVLTLGQRLMPGDDLDMAEAVIEDLVADVARRYPRCHFTIQTHVKWPPCLLDSSNPYAVRLLEMIRQDRPDASFGFDDPADDASWLMAKGIPTVLCGPGDPAQAHAADEHVALDDMFAAASAYASFGANRSV